VHHLTGTVQHYAWGSLDAIPALVGSAPDGRPWAELWLGSHPLAPSRLADGRALDVAIANDPIDWLGQRVFDRFGARLPFLLKVLAAAQPLSLQAHPSEAQAAEGFTRETALGIALDAPQRVYKDPHHKPELLLALSSFDALCGFRSLDATVDLLDALAQGGAAGLAPFADGLRNVGGADGQDASAALRYAVGSLLTMAPGDQRHLVAETAAAAATHDGPWSFETGWMVELATHYGGDVGCVVALFLNCVRLQPGEALFLAAGNLHAYLGGTGIEIMAASDNVLRGGLTPKHVDVPELLRVVDFSPLDEPRFSATAFGAGQRFAPPVAEFSLHDSHDAPVDGPEIWLCTSGDVDGLRTGQAAFAMPGSKELPGGDGAVMRACVGAGSLTSG